MGSNPTLSAIFPHYGIVAFAHVTNVTRAAVASPRRSASSPSLRDQRWFAVSVKTSPRRHDHDAAAVTDPNFRIFTDRDTITVFNHEIFVRGTDIQEIFARLGVEEATHAFYLGRELMKAKLAITLGKTYRQEGQLAWGYLTPPDDPRADHVKLTQRKRRRRTAE